MNNKILVKCKEKTNDKFGKKPSKRTITELFDRGIINVDKDAGPTSQTVVTNVKCILSIDKAGHSGTLDPQVTGILLVGLGKATRLMEYMLKSPKEYVCLLYLHKEVDEKTIRNIFKKFTGKIMQTPPIVSAVKRQEREREIYENEILEIHEDKKHVLFRVLCQHGTYIRKLCVDMADSMGTKGQMLELRRTKAGPLREENDSISLDKLRNLYELYKKDKKYESELRKYIKPMEIVLKDFKKVYARDSAVNSLCFGSDLAIPGVSELDEGIELGEEVAILSLKGELIAMGTAFLTSKDVMKKNKGAFVKTHKVFMDPGTYPETWKFE